MDNGSFPKVTFPFVFPKQIPTFISCLESTEKKKQEKYIEDLPFVRWNDKLEEHKQDYNSLLKDPEYPQYYQVRKRMWNYYNQEEIDQNTRSLQNMLEL